MKTLLNLSLASILVFGIAGCGQENGGDIDNVAPGENMDETVDTAADENAFEDTDDTDVGEEEDVILEDAGDAEDVDAVDEVPADELPAE